MIAHTNREGLHRLVKKRSDNAPAGSQQFLASYQAGLTELLESLDDEEIEAAKETANQWNKRGPPAELKKQ